MSAPLLAAAAVLVPFVAAGLGPVVARRARTGAASVAVLGALGTAALLVVVVVGGERVGEAWVPYTPTGGIPIVLGTRVDELSATIGLMVALVALAVQIFSVGLLRDGPRYPSYSALVSLFTAAMLLVVFAADLLVLYVGWEIMGFCSYALIGHHWEQRTATAAALKAFLMTRVGDVGLLLGIILLGLGAGSFRITAVLDAVPTMSSGTLLAATLLIVLGVVAKSGQFPLHSWLPDAMAGPAPVSALIHAATMVAAGAYLVALLYPAFAAAPASLAVLGGLAAITMLGAALAALAAEDLKRVLAYSTVSQLALVFGALAVGGVAQGTAHLLAHAAFKALLFLAGGVVAVAVGATLLARMGGLRRRLPVTFAAATVGFAALAGAPPTSGFVSKDGVVETFWHGDGALAAVLLVSVLATTVVTGAYATRAWLRTFFGPPPWGVRTHVPASMTVPVVALAVPALGLGLWWVASGALPAPDPAVAVVTSTLAGLGALAGWLDWRRVPVRAAPALLASAFRTDDLYDRTVGTGALALAARIGRLDDGMQDAVSGTGRGTSLVGAGLRRTQTGNPQLYLTGLLAGVLLLSAGMVGLR